MVHSDLKSLVQAATEAARNMILKQKHMNESAQKDFEA
jgi:hypothetical protein